MIAWLKRRLHRHRTIRAIMREWGWSYGNAAWAVDRWGLNPWERGHEGAKIRPYPRRRR